MSGAPLYRDVCQSMTYYTGIPYLPRKTALSSERELCEHHHASRSTIRRALDALQQDGYINKMQGWGDKYKFRAFYYANE